MNYYISTRRDLQDQAGFVCAAICPPSTLSSDIFSSKVLRVLQMEMNEDILIVGAGIAGLTTCLGLHRYFGDYHNFLSGSSLDDQKLWFLWL